ncbi:MAG: trehalose-6-phosphate synthase, partial [Gammaproteobacteria bacterium]
QVILSVVRADLTKGVLQMLQAFEQLLEENPELFGGITLIDVCVPAAREMTIYRELERQIDECVGRINGRFGRLGYVPVQFLFQALPFEELVGLYAIADVMWITPLRDGLNLVAKEYVATRFKLAGHGVLVLSEFTGAAAELHGAILTNPHDRRNLVDAVLRALRLDEREARNLMTTLYNIVEYNDVDSWAQEFMQAARAVGVPTPPVRALPATA